MECKKAQVSRSPEEAVEQVEEFGKNKSVHRN